MMKGCLGVLLTVLVAVDACSIAADYFQFGTQPNSRIEYDHARGKFRKHFRISFDVKTNDSAGVIFYAADKENTNFVILYMESGQIIYKILSNKIIHDLQTTKTFNDGEWHKIVIVNNQSMQLMVDDNLEGERKSKSIQKLEIAEPLFLGGLRDEQMGLLSEYGNVVHSFKGCIRDFHVTNRPMEKPRKVDVQRCLENIEEGNYFNGGYAVLGNRYVVGDEIDIKMDIKPRNVSGLLLSVHGKRDYLVLEMYEGAIRFTVDNGRGPITTTFSPDRMHYLCDGHWHTIQGKLSGRGPITTTFSPDRMHYLCDGHWHTIQAIKSKNIVSLSVDNKFMTPSLGDHRAKSTDTGGALFLGSHKVLNKVRGITARYPFVGCIRNIHINNKPIIVTYQMRRGDVIVGQCATN
ncbi:Laminin G domain [Popillia japonica]|uniref:Laminin G domain n=1 Tax=Popillia japonica TaxID=7064 RepID=A0AAW1LU69_POPJA